MVCYGIFWSGQLEVSREIFSTFFSLFLLLNNAMYRRDFGQFFKVGEQVSIIFSFLRSSRYFCSIVLSINFYHVECRAGRQSRILVDNF